MAAGKHRDFRAVQQSKKMVPFITRKTTFGQHVHELVFGVNIFDLDLGVQVDSFKKTSHAQLCGFLTRSHRWTLAFDDHFDHCFVVLENVQLRLALRRIFVCGDVVHMRQLINISVSFLFGLGFVISRAVSCCSMRRRFGTLR